MTISKYADSTLGKEPCTTREQTWRCPNMKPIENDQSLTHEYYECKLCGRTENLDYDEIG
jgi:hypothetical protein